jgi:hypothetical protein
MNIHCGDEYKFVLRLLNSLDTKHENDLSLKIIRDNQDEIKKSIFNKSINVDDKEEKYQFLHYLYKKQPEIIQDIFRDQKAVGELFEKISRLLKGKPIEKKMACLYLFFVKQFTDSHSEQINAIESVFPLAREFSI